MTPSERTPGARLAQWGIGLGVFLAGAGIGAEKVWPSGSEKWIAAGVSLGALVAVVLCIPWLWYALLRRLRELAAAIRG